MVQWQILVELIHLIHGQFHKNMQQAQQVRNERKAEVENAKAVHEIENIQKQSQSRKERRKATKKIDK